MKNIKIVLFITAFLLGGVIIAEDQDSKIMETSSQMTSDTTVKAPVKVVSTKVLYNFEDEAEIKDFKFSGCTAAINDDPRFIKSGKKSLRLDLDGDAQWPGMSVGELEGTKTIAKGDWSGDYNALRFDVFNTLNEPVVIACRIDDIKSQNYKTRYNNNEITLKPGWNTVNIGFEFLRYGEGKTKNGKKIDIQHIRLFCIFSDMKKDVTIYIGNIRLDKLVEE